MENQRQRDQTSPWIDVKLISVLSNAGSLACGVNEGAESAKGSCGVFSIYLSSFSIGLPFPNMVYLSNITPEGPLLY